MRASRLIFGLLFIVIGLSALTGFDWFHYFVPFIFIFIGIRILLFRRFVGRHSTDTSELRQDEIDEVAVFSASEKHVASTNFAGGKAAAVFSGMELDLSDAKSKAKSIDLELVAVFGGLKVIVPSDWRVETNGAGVFGGYSNKTGEGKESAPKLVVHGAAIFGGVDIVN